MRSDLVYAASTKLRNRYQLCQTVARATRKLHIPSTPTASTINKSLNGIASGAYGGAGQILPPEDVSEIRQAVKRTIAVAAKSDAANKAAA
jgi:hypothetical protein